MASGKSGQAYSWEEVLSFDRLKRAMTRRVLDRIESMCQENEAVSLDQINEVISDEWQKVKQAARSSPAAREAFRKYVERTISDRIDELIQRDKAELGTLGVTERSL